MQQIARDKEIIFFYTVLLVSIPILLINLGKVPFLEDEGIRALVALEMDHSGNYVAPSINGEPYFKKPPLWNWIILASFKIFGQATEWVARLPMILCLYGFCLSIFLTVRRWVGQHEAILAALLFLTCGRILFWDSLLAFIDIAFSWVIFFMFSWIYHFIHKESYLKLFVGAYALTTIAFMLKALPAFVFLALTLLAAFIYYGNWRKLFSWQHLCGVTTMLLLLGTYLIFYTQHQTLASLAAVFVDESTQRTFIQYGWWDTLSQVVLFPLENLYHFLPWSFVLLLIWHRDSYKEIKAQPFVAYCALVFAANIWVYWTAPEVYPRYLFPLAPLYFLVGLYLYQPHNGHWSRKAFDIFCFVIAIGVCLGSSAVLFSEDAQIVPFLVLKWTLTFLLMATAIYLMYRQRSWQLHWFCVFLLAARLGFDLIVLPARSTFSSIVPVREDAVRIGQLTRHQDLAIYRSDTMRVDASFYLTRERGSIVPIARELPTEGYLLVNPRIYHTLAEKPTILDSLRVPRPEKHIYLVDMNSQ